jgi:hypothetical protein
MVDYAVVISETTDGISAYVPGQRASASLMFIGREDFGEVKLPPGQWLFWNRLINQSGIGGLGTLIFNEVVEYCKRRKYSILSEISPYGRMTKPKLIQLHMSKGFVYVNKREYGITLLMLTPINDRGEY